MNNYFSGDKKGRLAQQEYEKVVKAQTEEEFQKWNNSHGNANTMSQKELEEYHREVRQLIEERVREKYEHTI